MSSLFLEGTKASASSSSSSASASAKSKSNGDNPNDLIKEILCLGVKNLGSGDGSLLPPPSAVEGSSSSSVVQHSYICLGGLATQSY